MRSPEEIYADIERNNEQLAEPAQENNRHLYIGAMLVNVAELMVAISAREQQATLSRSNFRYQSDAAFYRLVTATRAMMEANQFSAGDITDAANLAADQIAAMKNRFPT